MVKINFSISNLTERHYPEHNPDGRGITTVPNFPNCFMLKAKVYGFNWYLFQKDSKWHWGKELSKVHERCAEGFSNFDECYSHLKNTLKGVLG